MQVNYIKRGFFPFYKKKSSLNPFSVLHDELFFFLL